MPCFGSKMPSNIGTVGETGIRSVPRDYTASFSGFDEFSGYVHLNIRATVYII